LPADTALKGQMKRFVLAFLLLAASVLPAAAQTYSDIDVDLPTFPEMQPVPDSPVYWAPAVDSNYFFYDGLFWDYYDDLWHWSSWYNGPWVVTDPVYVPTYVLWVPIAYYRRPPHFFRAWNPAHPPRWGEHWGRDWLARHNQVFQGAPRQVARAPLPQYQMQFSRANYPRNPQQQSALHVQHYGYQPREAIVRQHYQSRGVATGSAATNPMQRAAPPQDARRDEAPRERR
jgi:hypothetical protein